MSDGLGGATALWDRLIDACVLGHRAPLLGQSNLAFHAFIIVRVCDL
jgi:hypothetical protein